MGFATNETWSLGGYWSDLSRSSPGLVCLSSRAFLKKNKVPLMESPKESGFDTFLSRIIDRFRHPAHALV